MSVISIRTKKTPYGPRDFIYVDGKSTLVYTIPKYFPALRKFARDYKEDLIEYVSSQAYDSNYGFLFYMCGYSGPAQNAFRDNNPKIFV